MGMAVILLHFRSQVRVLFMLLWDTSIVAEILKLSQDRKTLDDEKHFILFSGPAEAIKRS